MILAGKDGNTYLSNELGERRGTNLQNHHFVQTGDKENNKDGRENGIETGDINFADHRAREKAHGQRE